MIGDTKSHDHRLTEILIDWRWGKIGRTVWYQDSTVKVVWKLGIIAKKYNQITFKGSSLNDAEKMAIAFLQGKGEIPMDALEPLKTPLGQDPTNTTQRGTSTP